MINFGPVPIGAVLPVIFDSFAGATGASVTMSGIAVTDIEIYKGTSMTQRASDAGYALLDTDGIDIDGVTGIHGFSIDTGDNTDAGFFASGSFYTVVVASITVDSQTVNFVAATFRCVTAETVAGQPKVDTATWDGTDITTGVPLAPATAGRTLVVDASGLADANMVKAGPTGSGTAQTAGDIIGDTNDIQSRIPAALGADGFMKASVFGMMGTALTETAGQIAAAFKKFFDKATPTGTINSLPDAVAGAAGGVAIVGSQVDLVNAPNATAVTAIQNGLATAANQTTILARLGSWTGTGLNTVLGAFRALMGKAAALTPTDISTGTTFDNTTDSVEAIRDQGDAAWITATGFAVAGDEMALTAAAVDAVWDEATAGHATAGTTGKALTDAGGAGTPLDAAGVRAAIGMASADLDTQIAALPTAVENADALLNRDMAAGTDSGSPTVRTVRQALRFLRNKWSLSGTTLTVTKEDDTTASWTSTVSTDAAAVPVVGNDPA